MRETCTMKDIKGNYHKMSVELVLEAARTLSCARLKRLGTLTSTQQTKEYLQGFLGSLEYETFVLVLLDTQYKIISVDYNSKGTIDTVVLYIREAVKLVLKANATSVILAHNHPNGDCTPSAADLSFTKKLKQALALIDVEVLDHIIVCPKETSSLMKDENPFL